MDRPTPSRMLGAKSVIVFALLTGLLVIALAGTLIYRSKADDRENAAPVKQPATLRELLAMPPAQRDKCDIARVNLLCAEGLPGRTENINIGYELATLDQWASEMRPYIESCVADFHKNPAAFRNNENICRMSAVITFLQRVHHISYDPAHEDYSEPSETFFKDSKDVFIHGLIGEPHLGTCASMPVLYVAVGRRLGYPLKLVASECHLFVRWESADGNSFNIEGTNKGMNSHDYDFYKKKPFTKHEEALHSDEYFRPLAPSEELATFLSTRGICLEASKRPTEAKEAYTLGASIAPTMKSCSRSARNVALNK